MFPSVIPVPLSAAKAGLPLAMTVILFTNCTTLLPPKTCPEPDGPTLGTPSRLALVVGVLNETQMLPLGELVGFVEPDKVNS